MGVKSLSERNVTLLQRTESLNLGPSCIWNTTAMQATQKVRAEVSKPERPRRVQPLRQAQDRLRFLAL